MLYKVERLTDGVDLLYDLKDMLAILNHNPSMTNCPTPSQIGGSVDVIYMAARISWTIFGTCSRFTNSCP